MPQRLSWHEVALPCEQRAKVLGAVTAQSPRARERGKEGKRVTGEGVQRASVPLRRLVPSVFSLLSETGSALLKPGQERLTQILAAETFTSSAFVSRKRKDRVEICLQLLCSLLSSCPRCQRIDSYSLAFFFFCCCT